MTTDASTSGWGAVCESVKTGGRWSLSEKEYYINVLELMAIDLALKSFAVKIANAHVKILSDNACAVAYITHMGGSQSVQCNEVANRIWHWCKDRHIWLSISHIAGKDNVEADESSRLFNDRTEWQLNPKIFQKLRDGLFDSKIDLFASRFNYQMKPYISWGPDPESIAVNAFSVNWAEWHSVYAFCPFSLILRTLNKWQTDGVDGLLIVPLWPTAAWFPVMLRMLIQPPVLQPRGQWILQLPFSKDLHPLHRKLQLLACVLSGKPSKLKVFKEKLCRSCVLHGEIPLNDSTLHTCLSGTSFAVDGVLIPCLQMCSYSSSF
jgi:ribonuclease HI